MVLNNVPSLDKRGTSQMQSIVCRTRNVCKIFVVSLHMNILIILVTAITGKIILKIR